MALSLFITVTEELPRTAFKKKNSILAHGSRGFGPGPSGSMPFGLWPGRRSWWKGVMKKVLVSRWPGSKEKERDYASSLLPSSFIPPGPLVFEMAWSGADSCLSASLPWKRHHRHIQRWASSLTCASQAIQVGSCSNFISVVVRKYPDRKQAMGERNDLSPPFWVIIHRFCGSQDRSLDSFMSHPCQEQEDVNTCVFISFFRLDVSTHSGLAA